MASITRAQVAARVHEKLDKLATGLSASEDGEKTEGDYTYPIDDALRDCGFDDITEADSHASIRAVLIGTEYRVAQRLFWRRSPDVSSSTSAAGSLRLDWNQLLEILRKRLAELRKEYVGALAAIGLSLDEDADAGSVGDVVLVDDDEDATEALVSTGADVGLPWYAEGYHEEDS